MGMTIAVTGHRPKKLWGYDMEDLRYIKLREKLEMILIEKFKETDQITAVSGMAIGVDTLFAEACLALKRRGYNIRLIAAVPFTGQETKWPESSQNLYHELLAKASEIVVVSEGGYEPYKMQKRNEYMVDMSDELIAVWSGEAGGTANCIRYAQENHVPVTRIYPQNINARC